MPARHCLLVVDDEPEVVHSLQDLLRFHYRVLGATRARDGMRLLEHEKVHIVMTDQRMPEMTGVEFLQELRNTHPDIVRLLFTGYADIRAVINAINDGNVFRYITKPWDSGELQTVLRQAAERYDLLADRKRLLNEVQEQNIRLESMNAELRKSNELKLAFMKVASHELRTPLTILLGLSELAQRSNGSDVLLPQWLESIHNSGKRLHRLVDQITKLMVAGNFDRPLSKTEVDVAELLRSAAQEVHPFIVKRGQTLEVCTAPDLGRLAVEVDKMRDSLTHLLLNAIKFTPDGGTIQLAGRRLPGREVEVRVTDNGVGIDAETSKHIFDAFFTNFDVSRHSSGVFEYSRRGLGVGLSLVKAFVEMHGGSVKVQTEVGKGSSFVITLPG